MSRRNPHEQWDVAVSAVVRPAARVVRVTLTAPQFAGFQRGGADEYFALVLPGQERVMRWYTIRSHRPQQAQIDVDIVLHGEAGPGSAWALQACEGDRVGVRPGKTVYVPPVAEQPQLIVADETAAPAVGAIGDWLRERGAPTGRVRALIEIPRQDHLAPMHAPFDVTVLLRGAAPPGHLVVPAVRDLALDADMTAWVCGESMIATTVRRHLVGTVGVPRRSVAFCGYWKVGQART